MKMSLIVLFPESSNCVLRVLRKIEGIVQKRFVEENMKILLLNSLVNELLKEVYFMKETLLLKKRICGVGSPVYGIFLLMYDFRSELQGTFLFSERSEFVLRKCDEVREMLGQM